MDRVSLTLTFKPQGSEPPGRFLVSGKLEAESTANNAIIGPGGSIGGHYNQSQKAVDARIYLL